MPVFRFAAEWMTSHAAETRLGPERRALARVALYVLLSRLACAFVAYYAVRSRAAVSVNPIAVARVGDNPWLTGILRWDAWWYISVVDRGYAFDPTRASNVAFLPGLPLLIELLSPVVGGPVYAGLLIAHLASAAAAFALFAWVRERAGLRAAERAVVWVLVYPFSFFFYTVYAEGLFFLLCGLAFLYADRRQWLIAGVCAALATLTRPMGILLAPAFGWAVLRSIRGGQNPLLPFVAALLPVAALAAYAVHLWVTFGDPFAVVVAHSSAWKAQPSLSVVTRLREAWVAMFELRPPYMRVFTAVQIVLPWLFLALSIWAWRRLGPVAGAYALLAWVVVVAFGVESAGRELLAVVPAFAVTGFASSPTAVSFALRAASFALLLLFTYGFAAAQFMG